MRSGNATAKAETPRLKGELLDMARHRIVGLVAMHVDHQAARGGDLAQLGDRARAVGHRALEMRNAADDVDAHVQRTNCAVARGRRPVEAILREGDQLQVDMVADLVAHRQERFDTLQPVLVGGVDMAADRKQAHRDSPVAIVEGAGLDLLDALERLQLAPQRNAFEQGTRRIDARRAVGERRVHVEMGVDEGRRDETARRVDNPPGLGVDCRLDGGDATLGDRDVGGPAVRHDPALDDQVEAHLSPFW